ncbi:MAG: hypothetical protein QG664_365 [Patescibacteria group bacterium]|nr:hypothetical protein [Patescibacteria group bacterium]
MQLYKIRGGNKEELESKQYNIGIGISLGNKWFSVDNIVALTKWALPYTREKVIIYVADSIHAINVEVRNRVTFQSALKKVDKLGSDILEQTRLVLESELPGADLAKITYCKWDGLANKKYKDKVDYLNELYRNDGNFQKSITSIVRGFTSKETRHFSDANILRLGQYIIEELPELINRVPMNGVECDAYVYPFDGELVVLTEKIQRGELFPEIKKAIMDTNPKVFLEVR